MEAIFQTKKNTRAFRCFSCFSIFGDLILIEETLMKNRKFSHEIQEKLLTLTLTLGI